jgi:hypothetical protein
MDRMKSFFASLHDARIAPHLASGQPAWLWSPDGERILFANAVGAAIFGADHVAAILEKRFDPSQIAATAIARLAPTLKHDGAPRLEKLRGFGAGVGRTLLCTCSRIPVGAQTGVLVVAAEPAGPNFSVADRVRRLITGFETALAAFAADGTLIHANEKAAALLADRNTLNDMRGSDALLDTIGEGTNAFTLVRFPDAQPVPAPAPERPEMADLTPIAEAMARTSALDQAADAALAEPAMPAAPGPEPAASAPLQDDVRPQMQPPAPAPTEPARCRTPSPVAFRLADGRGGAVSALPPANSWR